MTSQPTWPTCQQLRPGHPCHPRHGVDTVSTPSHSAFHPWARGSQRDHRIYNVACEYGAGLQQGAHHRLAIAITTVLHLRSEPVHTVVSSPKLSTCEFQSNSRSQDPISNVTQKSANTALPGAINICTMSSSASSG